LTFCLTAAVVCHLGFLDFFEKPRETLNLKKNKNPDKNTNIIKKCKKVTQEGYNVSLKIGKFIILKKKTTCRNVVAIITSTLMGHKMLY